jgi:hypothetical protein
MGSLASKLASWLTAARRIKNDLMGDRRKEEGFLGIWRW